MIGLYLHTFLGASPRFHDLVTTPDGLRILRSFHISLRPVEGDFQDIPGKVFDLVFVKVPGRK